MTQLLLESLYFILPAYVANMSPIFMKKAKFLDSLALPLDHGKTFRGKRILGDHKTLRGLFSGIIFGMLICVLQKIFAANFTSISLLPYDELPYGAVIFLGFLFGFGALFGDAVKSFFKRRLGIKPGEAWIPFDQLDMVIGGLLFASLIFIPPIEHIFIILLTTPIFQIFAKTIAYFLKMEDVWW